MSLSDSDSEEDEFEFDNGIPTWGQCKLYLNENSEHPTTSSRNPSKRLNTEPFVGTKVSEPLDKEFPKEDVLYQQPDIEDEFGQQPFKPPPIPNRERFNNDYEDDTEQWFSKPSNQPTEGPIQTIPNFTKVPGMPTSAEFTQYQTDLGTSTQGGHDPDTPPWLDWTGTEWDGQPIPGDLYSKTKQELCTWIRPTGKLYEIKGLREKFYEVNPFADNQNPTLAEVEAWNIEVINHIRDLLGIPNRIKADSRLSLEARWADERYFSEYWDTEYPGTLGSAYGPCVAQPTPINTHCGASFVPSVEAERMEYINADPYFKNYTKYPELQGYETWGSGRASQAESVKAVNTNVPWSVKFASMMAGFICGEGLTGHPGSFLFRDRIGYHSYVFHDGVAGTRYRFKFKNDN